LLVSNESRARSRAPQEKRHHRAEFSAPSARSSSGNNHDRLQSVVTRCDAIHPLRVSYLGVGIGMAIGIDPVPTQKSVDPLSIPIPIPTPTPIPIEPCHGTAVVPAQ
jgi:hypothetical protein